METKTLKLPRGLSRDEKTSLKAILAKKEEYVDNPAFHTRNAHIKLFRDTVDLTESELAWHEFLVQDSFSATKPKHDKQIMNKDEEVTLFLQFNFARYTVRTIQDRADTRTLSVKEARKLILWHQLAEKLKGWIIVGNLALIGNRIRGFNLQNSPERDWFEAMTQDALMRAVMKFDVAYGWKFSTYACTAMNKELMRSRDKIFKRAAKQQSLAPMLDKGFQIAEYQPDEEVVTADDVAELQHILDKNLAGLSEIERDIVNLRYGFEGKDMTLDEVGANYGVSKERIRQIQKKAIQKLQTAWQDRNQRFVVLKLSA